MSREIKFEYGFNSQNGIVKKVYYLSQIPKIAQICDVWNDLPICYVRQFTGLTDKNGKEIYEGDILKADWELENKNGYMQISDSYIEKSEVVAVCWHNEGFSYKLKNQKLISLNRNASITVIGNIYENPELLKSE